MNENNCFTILPVQQQIKKLLTRIWAWYMVLIALCSDSFLPLFHLRYTFLHLLSFRVYLFFTAIVKRKKKNLWRFSKRWRSSVVRYKCLDAQDEIHSLIFQLDMEPEIKPRKISIKSVDKPNRKKPENGLRLIAFCTIR